MIKNNECCYYSNLGSIFTPASCYLRMMLPRAWQSNLSVPRLAAHVQLASNTFTWCSAIWLMENSTIASASGKHF